MRCSLFIGLVVGATAFSGAWAATGPTLQDRQQAACYNDVMRLCSDYLPDADRVKVCMMGKKKQVSAPCAAFYPPGSK